MVSLPSASIVIIAGAAKILRVLTGKHTLSSIPLFVNR